MRGLTYYIGVSLDGFIAGPDHEVDGFDVGPELIGHIIEHYPETLPTPARQGLGVSDAKNQRFDTVLMGRHTYEVGEKQGLSSPYAHLRQIVLSSNPNAEPNSSVAVTPDNAFSVVEALKDEQGQDIWLCGGGQLAGSLFGLIDEVILKRYPVVLGAGRPVFAANYEPKRLTLVERQDVGGVSIETYRPV